MSNSIAFITGPVFQSWLNNGQFNQGGLVYTYLPGSNTPTASYSTVTDAQASTNPNPNPVILDSRGSATIIVTGPVKIVVEDQYNNVISTTDNVNITAANIYDTNGNALLLFSSQNNAVNQITIANAVTGSAPALTFTGSDSTVGGIIELTGNGNLNIETGATGSTILQGNLQLNNGNINGANGLEVMEIVSVPNSVNFINASNAITGAPPFIQAIGTDTNIAFKVLSKGNLGVLGSGDTSGGNIPAGFIGEENGYSAPVVCSSSTTTNILAKNFQPGKWIIFGTISTNIAATTVTIGLSTTSGTFTASSLTLFTGTSGAQISMTCAPLFLNTSAVTTVYLCINMTTAGNYTATGYMNGLRYA